jgi:PAS domain S-box-containing protein
MKTGSITIKLLLLISAAFLISALGVLVVANTQLEQIIDRSQNEMYEEKLAAICRELTVVDARLQKTGLVEAYIEDFQQSIIEEFRAYYYADPNPRIYPFILDGEGRVVLHPFLPAGDLSVQDHALIAMIQQSGAGDFVEGYKGSEKWYGFKKFEAWDWSVVYAVPLDIKYHDSRVLIRTLTEIMVGITLFVLILLAFILSRFTTPIVQLTRAVSHLAEGELDNDIEIKGKDEVAQLSRDFSHMRDVIRKKITDLNHEIAERKLAERKLQRNEKNLRITLDSIGDAVIATDTEGLIVRMNPVAEALVGWSCEEAKGRPLVEVFRTIDRRTREVIENPTQRILATGKVIEVAGDIVLVSRNGTEHLIADSGASIRSDSGESMGVVLVFRDVTQEHALQEQLQQSQKMDAIGQLAGGVAHDFNNMLGGIMGAAELLEDYLVDDPQAEKLHRMIMSSSERAAALTGKLLAFARKEPDDSGVVDMHKAINDTIGLLQRTLSRQIELNVDLSAPESQVVGNISQLQNSILNLGINASHAMPDGGTIFISTRAVNLEAEYCEASLFELKPGPYLEVEVRDTGRGIAPEVLPHIFEPFFTTKKTGQGTGLGLSVAYGTIRRHHGSITVRSEPDAGTAFTILLPLSKETVTQIEAPPEESVSGHGRILVADDESVVRFALSSVLEKLGYEVTLAENGKQALDIYRQDPHSFDLVILDMIMPEMNGRECFHALRKLNPEVRVVISSGFSREADMQELNACGLNGYIRKPYRSAALSQLVANVIGA